jgi:hypothetical protein
MHAHVQALLRRTAAAATAAAAFLIPSSAGAQTITLQGITGNPNCTYSGMTVTPAGNFTVNCQAAVAGAAGTFGISGAPASMLVSTTANMFVSRTGGTTGAYSVAWMASGACSGSGTVTFADGSATAASITVTAGASAANCTVAASNPTLTGGTAGTSPAAAAATVFPVVTASPGPVAGCTAPALGSPAPVPLNGPGMNNNMTLSSGTVGTFILTAPPSAYVSETINIGSTPGTRTGTAEWTISQCPGIIDPTAGGCYYTSTFLNWNVLEVFYQTAGIWTPAKIASLTAYSGYCNTIAAGQWYLNVRYTTPGGGANDLVYVWRNGKQPNDQ